MACMLHGTTRLYILKILSYMMGTLFKFDLNKSKGVLHILLSSRVYVYEPVVKKKVSRVCYHYAKKKPSHHLNFPLSTLCPATACEQDVLRYSRLHYHLAHGLGNHVEAHQPSTNTPTSDHPSPQDD